MDYTILLAFGMATAALSIAPGPDNIFVLVQSMAYGRKSGLAIVAGLMTGCLVHTTLVGLGAAALITSNRTAFFFIKVLGALYMLYLAYKVHGSAANIQLEEAGNIKKGVGQLYWQGFIMNVLNPKVAIFFLAFFPGFLFSKTMDVIEQFYILGLLFIVVASLVFGTIAVLAGSLGKWVSNNGAMGSVLKYMQIIIFVAIAIYIMAT